MKRRTLSPLDANLTPAITPVTVPKPTSEPSPVELPPVKQAPVPSYLDEAAFRREQALDKAASSELRRSTLQRIKTTGIVIIVLSFLSLLAPLIHPSVSTLGSSFIAGLSIAAGIGLLRRKLWGVTLLKVLSFLCLSAFMLFVGISGWVTALGGDTNQVTELDAIALAAPLMFLGSALTALGGDRVKAMLD